MMTGETARNIVAPMVAALVGGLVVSGINALSRRDSEERSSEPVAYELALESAGSSRSRTVETTSSAETSSPIASLESRVRELESAERARASTAAEPEEPTPADTEADAEELDRQLTEMSVVEPLDASWTDFARTAVDEVLGASDGPLVRVEELRCTTSLCRVVCTHDVEDANALFHQRLAYRGIGEALSRRVARPDGGYETHLFFAREGQYLPSVAGDDA